MKISQNLKITEFLDMWIRLESFSDTGTFEGDIYITPEDLPKLIKALQEIQSRRFDTEST